MIARLQKLILHTCESNISQRVGSNSGQFNNPPLLAMVVINIPDVALMSGEGSPNAWRHSCFMYSTIAGCKVVPCSRILFFRMRPLNERVGSSWVVSFVRT